MIVGLFLVFLAINGFLLCKRLVRYLAATQMKKGAVAPLCVLHQLKCLEAAQVTDCE
jgi:hypothetical protein